MSCVSITAAKVRILNSANTADLHCLKSYNSYAFHCNTHYLTVTQSSYFML